MRPVYYPQLNSTYGVDGNVLTQTVVFLAPVAAVATGVAASQGPVTGGASFTLNGSLVVNGVAIMDVARQVIITSAGNDSAITFTITGTNWFGVPISEVLTGANIGVATSVNSYKTVTKIVANSTTASTVTAGTNGVASSPPIVQSLGSGENASLFVQVTGTVNYSVFQTFDNPFVANPDAACVWVAVVAGLTAQTANATATISQPAMAYKLVINSNTAPGGAQIRLVPNVSIVAV